MLLITVKSTGGNSFTGQDKRIDGLDVSPRGQAGSDELVNLGLFADRRAAYRMVDMEGRLLARSVSNLPFWQTSPWSSGV